MEKNIEVTIGIKRSDREVAIKDTLPSANEILSVNYPPEGWKNNKSFSTIEHKESGKFFHNSYIYEIEGYIDILKSVLLSAGYSAEIVDRISLITDDKLAKYNLLI